MPHRFWRVSPNVDGGPNPQWIQAIIDNHAVFMGWPCDKIRGEVFCNQVQIGDVILIATGGQNPVLVAIGRVSSSAHEEADRALLPKLPPNLSFGAYRFLDPFVPTLPGPHDNGITFEGVLNSTNPHPPAIYEIDPKREEYPGNRRLCGRLEEILEIDANSEFNRLLISQGQIVLQGPPGTGKTYMAKRLAAHLLDIPKEAVDQEERAEGAEKGLFGQARFSDGAGDKVWDIVQFHPSYGYDDFVRGIEAKPNGQAVAFEVVPRTFEKLVKHHQERKKAGGDPRTVLIIDEINRANLAQVLGELIYGLEYRGSPITLPYGDEQLIVPRNDENSGFYIIGTMNTADRSVGRMDYAVRRRFAFITALPDASFIKSQPETVEGEREDKLKKEREWAVKLFEAVEKLFEGEYLAPEFHKDDVQVGHTYFLGDWRKVKMKFAYQVCPLLREYYKDGILLPKQNKDDKPTAVITLEVPGIIKLNIANEKEMRPDNVLQALP
jgi:MoxR-like ATPase